MEELAESTLHSLDILRKDLITNGGWIGDMVEFQQNPVKGIGVFANKSIDIGTILMKVPYSSCISVDLVMKEPRLNYIVDENPSLSSYPDEILAMSLMFAKTLDNSTSCPWSSHVKTFPESINTTLYWSDDELLEVKNTNIFHMTKRMAIIPSFVVQKLPVLFEVVSSCANRQRYKKVG